LITPSLTPGLNGDLDFLVHPNCGCNYADHVFWGLHATTYIPANRQGVAEEALWYNTYAPPVDPWSIAYPGNSPVAGCGLQGNETVFGRFVLQVLYNSANAASKSAKQAFWGSLTAMIQHSGVTVQLGEDRPEAYREASSTALSSEHALLFEGSDFNTIVPWAMLHRPAHVDLRLVPLSDPVATLPLGPGACLYGDYMSRAMYAGAHWELNEAPIENGAPGFKPLGSAAIKVGTSTESLAQSTIAPNESVGCQTAPKAGFLLYMSAVSDNGYQMYSAGLDDYQSGLAQGFQKAFPSQDGCEAGGTEVCGLGVSLTPYNNGTDPMILSYSHAYIPSAKLAEVVSWAMDNHIAAKVYYDVDLRLVPLGESACLEENYVQQALKTGPDWRLNTAAFQKAR